MILKFRMLSDENDNFVRDFEVMPEMTLAGLHDFIIESLGLRQLHRFVFYGG